jgi:hypothetical protein
MRSIILAAVAALAVAAVAPAPAHAWGGNGTGPCSGPLGCLKTSTATTASVSPYKLDAKGMCHDAKGQYVGHAHCEPPKHPSCKPGVSEACGNTCIAKGKVCHRDAASGLPTGKRQ